ncbi:polyhydroxyalkanoate depolymerase [Paracoccus caeni]|uniref:Polyhydroxyalkanoate depolymerase n=1 Tax=Paracoccus caeni TaxID=657651 RepID=A0A934SIZ0_9RHOB|nr:polyhydroxyalkanoate depolymerase [Paracoccus caeni]MBK4215308.1 polyhydroxyalkanoate depolymerase [Paracoccus caeni]
MAKRGLTGIVSYDAMETIRNTNEWMGATARAIGAYPAFALSLNPAFKLMSAWGRVTERSFARMVAKPDWQIPAISGDEGQDHVIYVEPVLKRAFGDLVRFRVARRDPSPRKVLLVAPMSGHYATLLRSTVVSLLPDCDVYVTDWHNARDIPVSKGKFDIEDYTSYLVEFIKELGPDTNVIAICQPAPLALAATAILAEQDPAAQPRTLTLIGGPVDPDAAATEVTDFGNRMTMGELEHLFIQSVGFKYAGAGRMVYPGLAQLTSFIAMNAETHSKAFINQVFAEARGTASEHDKHNKFYDEYLAVMDMTAEFYLSTVERIFKNLEIAQNRFTVNGQPVDLTKIKDVAIMTVEGANDDISAPGQCVAALELCSGVPADKKIQHLEPGAGHYGIFAGKSWRLNIRPLVLDFIDANMDQAHQGSAKKRRNRPAPTPVASVTSEPPAENGKMAV